MTGSNVRIATWLIPSALILASLILSIGLIDADDGYKVSRTSPSSVTHSFAPGISLIGSVQTIGERSSIGGGYSVTGGLFATVADPPHAFPIPALSSPGLVALAMLLLIAVAMKVSRGARAIPTSD